MVRIRAALDEEREARRREAVQRALAENERREAERQRNEVVLLADRVLLDQLRSELEGLWISTPSLEESRRIVATIDRWVASARALLERAATHRDNLASLRRAGRWDGTRWVFDTHFDTWRHGLLAELAQALDEWHERDDSLLRRAEERRRRYAAWEEWSLAQADVWRHASAEIANRERHPRYGGLVIAPQLGLLPLGPDPESQLWEFAVFGSGEIPVRGADGCLVARDVAAIVLVLLPGGTFAMGARADGDRIAANVDPGAEPDEGPVHDVTLQPFLFAKHELTRYQAARLRGWTQVDAPTEAGDTPRHPVLEIDWDDAAALLRPLGMTLPTEAQWEYAARGGTRSTWWTGDVADEFLRAESIGSPRLFAVGSGRPNAFGLHDVQGNVREWCQDPWGPYTAAPRDGDGLRNADKDPHVRCVRGGSWKFGLPSARSANRSSEFHGLRINYLGVRPARPLAP